MYRITALSIRSLLLLITLVVALPAAGIILYSGIQFRNAMLEDASKETVKLADRIATDQQNLVAGAEQLMRALAQLPEVRGRDAARVVPVLRELLKLNPLYSNIFIADREGLVWATAVPVPPPFIVGDRRYFRNALASGRLSAGEYIVSRATARPSFNLACPLRDDHGAVIGVISVGFVIDRYRVLLERLQLPAGTSFILMDHKGVIVSRGLNPEPYIGKPYPAEEFRKIEEGPEEATTTRTGLVGDKRIISYRKMRLAGESTPYLYLTAGIPVEAATREANRALRYNVALLAPFLLLAYAGAVWIGQRSIVDRVRRLENASRDLAAGNLHARVSDLVVGGELGRLGKTFDAMAEQLALREAERLKAAEERDRLVSILETTTDVVGMVSPEGRIFYFNHAGRVLTGMEAQPAAGIPLSQVYPRWAAERVMTEGFPTAIQAGAWEGETALLDGHGGEVPVSQVILSHRDAQGNLSHLSTIMRDISERKLAEAENDLLTRQLIQAQKMESIGQLAGGVAHDFNNLLTPIIAYSELLQMDLPDDTPALAKLGNILKAAQKAKDLVRQLLSFSRKQVMEMEVLDLNEIVAAFHGILRHTIRESIAIRLDLEEGRQGIRADRNQIEQVIMNLAVNAQDAIGERGTITIETASVLLDDTYAHQHPEVHPGHYLMLAITDDGCGMDQETRHRIFEPFFTTKGVGKGTGLGLATVYGIVRQHGGTIWVYSEPGQGATFKCYFPVVDELPTGEKAAAYAGVSLAGDRRTILLVEDNEMIRTLVNDLLSRQGFEVLVAEDPRQALQISRNRGLDLLITDVVMPYMTGPELHAKLLAGYPGLKALYMSGYTSNIIAQQGMLGEGVRYLQKPFAISEFLRTAEALLKP